MTGQNSGVPGATAPADPGVHQVPDGRGPAADTGGARLSLGARLLTFVIIAYRRWVSPALPARCRFYPSCSAYALEAVATHGALRGFLLAVGRLLRCHPFHPGGYDPVPPRSARRRADATGASS